MRNYRYAWRPRPSGPPRAIERPKPLLKETQRRILHGVLDVVPAHDAAHGFRRGHSALTHARRHVGRRAVLRFDLEDFFGCVSAGRVYGIFRVAGYPEAVAHLLTGLCTNVVPADEWARVPPPADPHARDAHARLGRRLATPHLPQGAPTSPALANLAAFRLDTRLAGLADRLGATYSRYADDLTLSGDARLIERHGGIARTVEAIARDEGFRLNPRKSQLMPSGGRQRVCGIVVNVRPNLARGELDRLRAAVHRVERGGPPADRAEAAQLRARLTGQVAWAAALNPARGGRLRRRLAAIDWE